MRPARIVLMGGADRRGKHDAGGGVQHLGRSRGGAAGLPLGDRRDDDRARRHARRAPDAGVAERFRRAGRVGTFVAELVEFFKQYHARTYGWDGAPIHDAVAMAHVLRPGSSAPSISTSRSRRNPTSAAAGPWSTTGIAPTASRMRRSAWRSTADALLRASARAHRDARLMPPGLGRVAVASLGAAALAAASLQH